MEKFLVLLPILTCILVGTSAQFHANVYRRERFNVTLNELRDQCNYNGGRLLYDSILSNLRSFRSFRNNLLGQLNAATQGSPASGDYRTIQAINQICQTNQEVINRVRQLIENIQICLSEENRLTMEEARRVLENTVTAVCIQLDFERALFTDPQCLNELMTSLLSPTDECSLRYPRFKVVYTLEPIPITHSHEDCSDFIRAADCRLLGRISCDPNLMSIIKQQFDAALGLIYC